MKRASELHWEGLEALGRGLLRARIRVDGARQTRVFVTVSLEGLVLDIQAEGYAHAATTGDASLDEAVRELVAERLSFARDATAYEQAAQARGQRGGGSRRRGR